MKKKTVMIMCAVFTMLTSIVSCSEKAQRSADTIPADTLQASLIIADSTCSDNFINSQDLVNYAVHVETQQGNYFFSSRYKNSAIISNRKPVLEKLFCNVH